MHPYITYHRVWVATLVLFFLVFPCLTYGQEQFPPLASPPLKPMVKMTGFINATPAPTNIYPVLTLRLPGQEKLSTFLLTDMKVMAGPLRTSESILSAVRPYTPNFHIRASRDTIARLTTASPIEPLSILALYSQSDRALIIENIEAKDSQESSE